MKIFVIICLGFLFSNCSVKQINTEPTFVVSSACPPDGKCSIELLQNKSLEVKTDEFGSIYYQIENASETSVVLYKYDKIVPPDLQDANYREEIIFEINNSSEELVLSGKELQQTKMLFGRFCFCRGQTGNYKVEQGNLNLKKEGKSIQLNLDFTITKVPQIINSIQATIK